MKRRNLIRWRNRGRHWLTLPLLLIVLVFAAALSWLQGAVDGRRNKEA